MKTINFNGKELFDLMILKASTTLFKKCNCCKKEFLTTENTRLYCNENCLKKDVDKEMKKFNEKYFKNDTKRKNT